MIEGGKPERKPRFAILSTTPHVFYSQKSHVTFLQIKGGTAPKLILGQKKKTSLFPVAGLKIAMRNAVFYFFFYNSWKSNAQCDFYFFKQNFWKKIHQNNSLGFFFNI